MIPKKRMVNVNKTALYLRLLRRRNIFYIVVLGAPLAGVGSITWISEKWILLTIAMIYVFLTFVLHLMVYYASCPKCGDLFFGPVYKENKIYPFKFFLNSKCNQCGYKGE